MEKYPRKSHFSYFNNMAYPYVGVTVEADSTSFLSFGYCDCTLDQDLDFEDYAPYANKKQEEVSTLCHHALVDGRHIGEFYKELNSQLEKIVIE